jgi:hypothetical protein
VACADVEKKFRRITVYIVYYVLNFDIIFGESVTSESHTRSIDNGGIVSTSTPSSLTIYVKPSSKDSMSTADAADHPPVEDARDELQEAVPEAAAKLRELLGAEDERVQIRAAEAILDRAGVTKAKRTSTTTAARDVGGESRDDGLDELL